MAHIHSNALIGASGAAGAAGDDAYIIPKSLRFNSGDSAYLSKTFASAGNRRTWTFSCWLKRASVSTEEMVFNCSTASNNYTQLYFQSSGELVFAVNTSSVSNAYIVTTQVFRDPSAFYHLVAVCDTTESSASDRLKLYVNGSRITSFSASTISNLGQNAESTVNSTLQHSISSNRPYGTSTHFNGLLSDIQFVDGQALAPTDFGETRSSDGVWVPKEYTTTFQLASGTPTTANGGIVIKADDSSINGTFVVNGGVKTWTSPDGQTWTRNGEGRSTAAAKYLAVGGAGTATKSFYPDAGSGNYTYFVYNGNEFDGTGSPFTLDLTSQTYIAPSDSSYGINGFHLNFSDSSTIEALGFDSAPTIPALDPKKGMDVITYTGTGSLQNIGGLQFEPGLIWQKPRSNSNPHQLYDSVRGDNARLKPSYTDAQYTYSAGAGLTFNPDGFAVGTDNGLNQSGQSFVAWVWRAGGPAVANTSGTITSQVSANTDYGFSICTFNSPSTYSSAPFGHGLPSAPKWVLLKRLDGTSNWTVYHAGAASKYFFLNTNAAGAGSNNWTVTSTTVDPGAGLWSATNAEHVAYCWSEVSGYSKFGSYSGSGSAGLKVTTGFKPRWILIKKSNGSADWLILDTERGTDLGAGLYPNANYAEASYDYANLLDDGFTLNTGDLVNASGDTYIYAAFADRPGNNWDVNNLVTNEGLSTSKNNFDVVTYTGNGGAQKIGGPVFSSSADTGLTFADGVTGMFDGSLSTRGGVSSTDNSYKTLTDGVSISASTGIRIYWNGVGAGQRYIRINGTTELDDGSAQLTPGWSTQSSFSGTINKIEVKTASSGSWSLSAVEVDGTILIDGTGPGLKFQPDFVWLKSRTAADSHSLFDSVRGAPKGFHSNTNGAEFNDSSTLTAFNSDGFTLAGHAVTNANNQNYVAWCWKAGSTAVSNSDGSITSSVSANAAYGFSIVSFTGTGTGSDTVGHGLNAAPKIVIIKDRDNSEDWAFYHSIVDGSYDYMYLNTDAANANSGWNLPTNSVFAASGVSGSGNKMIAYCFADVPGYQRIGTYTGNGNSTGPVVVTGFKPRFLLVKNTNSSRNWVLWDTERANNDTLKANSSAAEESNYQVDALPNGFQIKNTWNEFNENGATILYLAIGDDEIGSDEDCLVDVPNAVTADADATDTTGGYQRGNYAVLNPLMNPDGQNITLANGNLSFTSAASSGQYGTRVSTIGVTSGKWYAEFTVGVVGNGVFIGITRDPDGDTNFIGAHATSYGYLTNGQKYNNNSGSSYGSSYTANDVISIAMDLDNGTVAFYKNGVSQGTAYSSLTASTYFMGISGAVNAAVVANFGQMRFKYPIPTGYAALNTTALPAATIPDASVYFNTQLWTGNGADNRTVTGYGFQPDLAWIKVRNQNYNHNWQDAVIGTGSYLSTNNNTAATTENRHVKSFDSDGFTLGTGGFVNGNNDTYVGWAWDAGSSTVSNTSGSITSSVRANPSAGFSICKITTPSSAGAYTFGHGLNAVPELIIYRIYDQNMSWYVYHKGLGAANKYTLLNATNAANSGSYVFNNTYPTSTLVTDYASNSSHHNEGRDMIYYCFAPVAGFSKIGTFVNPSASEGAFVYCGFRPAFLLAKCAENISSSSGTGDWIIQDSKRSPSNTPSDNNTLVANVSNAEDAYYNANQAAIDFLSNGFKIRHNNTSPLGDPGRRYIFIVFAENPFQANGGLAR